MLKAITHFWTSSIKNQLILGIALVHALLMSIFVIDLVNREHEFLLKLSHDQASGLAATLAANGSSWLLANDFIGMEEVVNSQSSFPNLKYAMFTDLSGKVLGYTDKDKVGKYVDDEISKKMIGGGNHTLTLINDPTQIDIATPVYAGKQHIGWARVGINRSNIIENLNVVTKKGVIYTLLAIFVGIVFAWYMARGLLCDIEILADGMKQVQNGMRNFNFKLSRKDELSCLSHDICNAISTLGSAETTLNEQKKALEENYTQMDLVIKSTGVGIWDWQIQTGNIILNERWCEIIGYTPEELSPITINTWLDHLHPDDLKQSRKKMESHWRGEIDQFIYEARMKHKDGHWVWVLDTGKVVEWHADGKPKRMLGTHLDITERHVITEKLSFQASHDSLTGLINRTEFERRLEHLLQQAEQKITHALLYLDLDQFKIINDTSGHTAGDDLLRRISDIIKPSIRQADLLARIGGDEFAIILENCDAFRAQKIAKNIINAINDFQFIWGEKVFRIGVSIGLIMIDDKMLVKEEVLKKVDTACFAAKDAGRNRYHIYQSHDVTLIQQEKEMDWLSRIEKALDEKLFTLFAQPIVPISTSADNATSYELLIRMQLADGSIIPPGSFLSAAERYNKIIDIDQWVVKEAISILSNNHQFLERINYCSINLSGQSLADNKMLKFIIDQISSDELLLSKLCFEITETTAINNLTNAMTFISVLRGLGVRFSLDDFGSGLSSFAYLKNLPIDHLKIDGMFVKDIVDDPIDRAMVKSIHEVGSVMGKKTIAEFVENEEILNALKDIGVDYAQGYGIGKPVPLLEIIESELVAIPISAQHS